MIKISSKSNCWIQILWDLIFQNVVENLPVKKSWAPANGHTFVDLGQFSTKSIDRKTLSPHHELNVILIPQLSLNRNKNFSLTLEFESLSRPYCHLAALMSFRKVVKKPSNDWNSSMVASAEKLARRVSDGIQLFYACLLHVVNCEGEKRTSTFCGCQKRKIFSKLIKTWSKNIWKKFIILFTWF